MTVADYFAVAGSGALVVLVVFMIMSLVSMNRALASLRATLEELRRETVPLVGSMRSTLSQASSELERVDGLLTRAESVSATVDSASRLAYLTFSNPVIKALAFGSGTARAARFLARTGRRSRT